MAVLQENKDVELMKIQIYSERIHARLTYLVSTTFAFFIGFSVVFYTLFYQNVFSPTAFGISMIPISAGTVYELYRIRQGYKKELGKISDMMEAVKKGKELPRLEELINK